MKFFKASELVGLPGMPSTVQGVRFKARNENWVAESIEGYRGKVFSESNFPLETQSFLAKERIGELSETSPYAKAGISIAKQDSQTASFETKAKSLQKLMHMPEKARGRADAKSAIVAARSTFCAPYIEVRKLVKGEKAFCEAYTRRELDLPDWVYNTVKSISMVTVRRWETALKVEGEAALAGKYITKRLSSVDAEPGLADFLKGVITAKPHLANKSKQLKNLADIYREKNDLPWHVPSASSIRRWSIKWISDNQAAYAFTTNPKKFNDKYRTAIESMYAWMSLPNDVWEFDSTPVDAMLKEGRHSIIAVIDCYTRRVKLLVSPTSSSEGICLLLRKTLMSWGVPNEGGLMRTDNGSDYVSKRTTSIYQLLDLKQSRANPYSGWEKPFIERFFKTLSHDLIELLPGYIGHNVADRETIEARKEFAVRLKERNKKENQKADFALRMTQPELQEFLDNWIEAYYHLRPHEGLKGKTPDEVYRAAAYTVNNIADPEALDVLLNYAGEATVLKGLVKVNGLRYVAPEMLEHEWKGQKVKVFLDPNDVGRAFIYRLNDWQSRIEAFDQRMLGREISPDTYRIKKREDNKALRNFRREMQNLAKTYGAEDIHQTVVEHYQSKAESLVSFPKNQQPHDNEAISALAKAAKQNDSTRTEYNEAQIEHLRQKRKSLEERKKGINQQHANLIRSEHDKARTLATESLSRPLTPKEENYLKEYKKHNKLGAKRIDEIMSHKRQATN